MKSKKMITICFLILILFLYIIYPRISIKLTNEYPIFSNAEFIFSIFILLGLFIINIYNEINIIIKKLNTLANKINLILSFLYFVILIYSIITNNFNVVILIGIILIKDIIYYINNNKQQV